MMRRGVERFGLGECVWMWDLPLENGGEEGADPEASDSSAKGVEDWFQLIDVEGPAVEAKTSDRQFSKESFVSVWYIKV